MILPLCLAVLLPAAHPEPLRIDSSTARQLLSTQGLDRGMPSTAEWSMIGPVGDSAILLSDGTEFARVPWSPGSDASPSAGQSDTGWKSFDGFRPTIANLRTWIVPPSGFALRLGASTSATPATFPTTQWYTGFEGRFGWQGWVSAGLGARFDQLVQTPRVFRLLGDSSVPSAWSWTFSVCGPVVCLETEQHPLPAGSHAWRQPGLDSLLHHRKQGNFWTASGDSTYSGTWERRLVARFGVLEYRVASCPGLWAGTVQSLGLRDLPAGFTSFGAGVSWTRDRAATWLEFAAGPAAWRLPRFGAMPWSVELEPVRLRLDYRDIHEFFVSLQTTISIPDPTSAFGARIHP